MRGRVAEADAVSAKESFRNRSPGRAAPGRDVGLGSLSARRGRAAL